MMHDMYVISNLHNDQSNWSNRADIGLEREKMAFMVYRNLYYRHFGVSLVVIYNGKLPTWRILRQSPSCLSHPTKAT